MNHRRCDSVADSRAGTSELLEDAGHLEREAGDAGLEDAAALGVHLVGAFHRAERCREHRAAGVAMRFTARERGLLADDARTTK